MPKVPAGLHLFDAASAGQRIIAELLIDHGADVNARDRECRTLLHYAALEGNMDLAKLVISKGAWVDAQDPAGRTALHFAARGHGDIAKLLRESVTQKGCRSY
ncbi:MAG: ankyrin repeat domain-containing protein [Sedimentisphaerales bacterium]